MIMNTERIEYLIEKYENGTTTLQEEEELRSFLLGDQAPAHLRNYRLAFRFFNASAKQEMEDAGFDEKIMKRIEADERRSMKPSGKRWLYPAISAAATILVLVAVYFFSIEKTGNETVRADTFEDPRLAYAETRKVMVAVSNKLNSGMDDLSLVDSFHDGLNELERVGDFRTGMNELKKISVFHETRKTITSKNK